MHTPSIRVLLIERSEAGSRLLTKKLTALGPEFLRILHVKRLDEALKRMDRESFDAALFSFSDAAANPMEALQQLRERSPRLPIIVLAPTGTGAPAMDELREGVQGCMVEEEDDPKAVYTAILAAAGRAGGRDALHESEERLRVAWEAARAMVYEMDARTGSAVFAQGLRQLVGYGPGDVPQRRDWWFARIHKSDLPVIEPKMQEASAGGNDYCLQYRVRHKNGKYIVVEDKGRNILDDKGRIVRSVGSVTDITERKRSQDALRRSEQHYHRLVEELERMVERRTADLEKQSLRLRSMAEELTHAEERERRRLAQAMHDDLQQQLVGARFCAETLGSGIQKASLKGLVNRLVQLLNNAIESSRSLAFELSPPILHNTRLVQAMQFLERNMKERHGLSVNMKLEESAEPETEELKILLFHSVRELLFNVVKHAQTKTAGVELRRIEKGCIRVTVSDDGIGFNPEQLGRADSGAGFGLSSIRERLNAAGGNLDIKSVSGSGSRFTITLPLGKPKADVPAGDMLRPMLRAKPDGRLLRSNRKRQM